jgi:hypothetical protein
MIHLRFTVSGLGVGRYGFDSSQEQVIFRYSTKFRPVLGLTQPLIQWVTKDLCLRVGQPGSEAGYSLPPSVKVKNGGAIPSRLICLQIGGQIFFLACTWTAFNCLREPIDGGTFVKLFISKCLVPLGFKNSFVSVGLKGWHRFQLLEEKIAFQN